MSESQEQYIGYSRRCQEKEDAGSVCASCTLRENLEAENAPEAKRVLADAHDLLDFKKSAYGLFSTPASKNDRKDSKRLGSLKKYVENWGDTFAAKRPKAPVKIKGESKRGEGFPSFRYHPRPLETGMFQEVKEEISCDCCGKPTRIYYEGPFYGFHVNSHFCPNCIASREAAQKHNGEFQGLFFVDEGVSDPVCLGELIYHTPSYIDWRQEYWRAYCDGLCAYLGDVGVKEMRLQDVLGEVLEDPM